MAGCNECKFHESKLGDFGIDGRFQSVKKCALDKNSDMNQWWKDNADKHRSEELDDMDCHVYSDSMTTLINMNDKAQEILDLLDNKTN